MVKRRAHTRTNSYGTTFQVREHDFAPGASEHEYKLSWKHGQARINGSTTYQMPCPKCARPVFYYRNEHGSRVFFDKLGIPWPKHPCMLDKDASTLPLAFAEMVPVSESMLWDSVNTLDLNSHHNANLLAEKLGREDPQVARLREMRKKRKQEEEKRARKADKLKKAEEKREDKLRRNKAKWEAEGKPMRNADSKVQIVRKKPGRLRLSPRKGSE
ncbi:hypothetical protein [Roseovarius confluentis]|uniref:hypothetical protein n=1 Tax=Roseovarius confluentis TaxID=1852027 RepID=UPI0011AF8565|nr:hypothetical protein [Roseovarius confluentis]